MHFILSILTEQQLETQTPCVLLKPGGRTQSSSQLTPIKARIGLQDTSSYNALLLTVPNHRSITPVSH